MNHPKPWLRYVDAGDVDDEAIDFDGMHVESPTGEHLGDVDGFIIDSHVARPYYVVVASGGWFRTRHFLLPIGHARLDADREVLVADMGRDRIERFPGFDLSTFDQLREEDVKRLNDQTCQACAIEGVVMVYPVSERYSDAWNRPDFKYPEWWRAQPTLPDRMGASAVTAGVSSGTRQAGRDDERHADPSPHFDGRAQPGDVIGIETSGEQTHIGETKEDENERRRS